MFKKNRANNLFNKCHLRYILIIFILISNSYTFGYEESPFIEANEKIKRSFYTVYTVIGKFPTESFLKSQNHQNDFHVIKEKRFSDFLTDNNLELITIGSAFSITKDGYILTNRHVIELDLSKLSSSQMSKYVSGEGVNVFLVKSIDNEENKTNNSHTIKHPVVIYFAQIAELNTHLDLALLKISDRTSPVTFRSLESPIKQAASVGVLGSPLGYRESFTQGSVSYVNREVRDPMNPNITGIYLEFKAPINVGDSGGPVFDAEGRVVGVTDLILTPGFNFAIPSESILDTVSKVGQFELQNTKNGIVINNKYSAK